MPTCLLDKNVVRRAIEGIGKAQIGQTLSEQELATLRLLLASEQGQPELFISIEMQNILAHYQHIPDVQLFQSYVRVLRPARYFKRWTRRLREHGFTREDAKVIALATFGAEPPSNQLGVEWIATYDIALINHASHLRERLVKRLKAMTVQLAPPYTFARFPMILTPDNLS